MQRWKLFGLIVALVCGLIFAPVAACHADVTKTGAAQVCVDSPMTYTITATLKDANNWYVKVVDYLPSGVTYISSSPSGTYDASTNTVTWTYGPVAQNVPTVMTVTVKPTSAKTFKNSVKTWVRASPRDAWNYQKDFLNLVTTTSVPCLTTITKDAPERACTSCDLTYNLHVTYTGINAKDVTVTDNLPAGVNFISASDGGAYGAGTVTWNFPSVSSGWSKDLTLVINPGSGAVSLENVAQSSVVGSTSTATSNTVLTEIVPCVPEFPTVIVPAITVIGMLLIAGYLKRKDI